MAQEKHTPGPWVTDAECGNESVLGPDGFMVADCAIFSMRKGAPTEERNRANARLIAAAPELYRELRGARCPRPCNQRPDEFEVGQCVDAGECGCSLGEAVRKAEAR